MSIAEISIILVMVVPAGIEAFREQVVRAFPPRTFDGLISTHDECDDGIALQRELRGRRWDELSPEALFHGSIALSLLEPRALVAFLPAWLVRSMETFDKDSIVLEFTLYFLSPGCPDEHEGRNAEKLAERVVLFDAAQRNVVGELLHSILNCKAMSNWHPYALHALKMWAPETLAN